MIEIEQIEQVVLSFELSVLLIQFDQVRGGAGAVLLNEADVVLFLKLEHFVFTVAQIFFDLDKLLGDSSGHFMAAVFAQTFFEIEILLHDCIQIGLGVIGRTADGGKIENRCARLLNHEYLHRNGLQFGMSGANQGFRAPSHLCALDQLDLGAKKVHAVFAIDRALSDIQFAGHHHFTGGLIRGRCLINQKSFDKQPEADGQNWNPPAAQEQRFVAMQPGNKNGRPRRRKIFTSCRHLHTTC